MEWVGSLGPGNVLYGVLDDFGFGGKGLKYLVEVLVRDGDGFLGADGCLALQVEEFVLKYAECER